VTRVGITAVALRQKVETVSEKRPKEMEGGYTVKAAVVHKARLDFNWSKEYRDAGRRRNRHQRRDRERPDADGSLPR